MSKQLLTSTDLGKYEHEIPPSHTSAPFSRWTSTGATCAGGGDRAVPSDLQSQVVKQGMNGCYKRNQRWINPFVGGAMLGLAPILHSVIIAPAPSPLPGWVVSAALAFAGLAAGLGAAITNTTSARAIRFIGTALAAAAILHAIYG